LSRNLRHEQARCENKMPAYATAHRFASMKWSIFGFV